MPKVRKHSLLLTLVLFGLVTSVAACGGDDDDDADSSATSTTAGREW